MHRTATKTVSGRRSALLRMAACRSSTRTATFVLLAHAVAAYELGEDVTLCWVTITSSQETSCAEYLGPRQIDCNGSSIEMSFASPVETDGLRVTKPLDALIPHTLNCAVHVATPALVANLSIAHFNLHSCTDHVGLCTPFVKQSPDLSTHSAVQTGVFSTGGDAQFVQDLSLDEGIYTVIAHARWFDIHGVKHDVARARKIVVQPVPTSRTWTTVYATVITFCVLLLICAYTLLYRRHKRKTIRHRLRTAGTNTPFAMPQLSESHRWHLFLSHCWGTGQDQVHMIKKELRVLVPSLSVFLDVDDLNDFSAETLQASVRDSGVILIFLSRGYFMSKNCAIECTEAIAKEKPLVLVHESDTKHGGAPLDDLLDECPAELRPKLRRQGQHILLPWLRAPEYRCVVFKHLVAFTAQRLESTLRAKRSSKQAFVDLFSTEAAIRLQSFYRGRLARKRVESTYGWKCTPTFNLQPARQRAAIVLQSFYRGRLARKQVESSHGWKSPRVFDQLPQIATAVLPTATPLKAVSFATSPKRRMDAAASALRRALSTSSDSLTSRLSVRRRSRASLSGGMDDGLIGHLMCDHKDDPPLTKLHKGTGRGTFMLPGDEPPCLLYSTSNAGAAEIAAELSFHIAGLRCEEFVSSNDALRERSRLVERVAGRCAFFLLVLNKKTWASSDGTSDDGAALRLAATVKAASFLASYRGRATRAKSTLKSTWKLGIDERKESGNDFHLLMVHAVDDVPSFDYFFQVTPAELVLKGLYKEKAEPWLVHDSYRAISICGIAKLLGARRAKAREKSRATACEPARETSRSPSPGDSAV